MSGARLFLSTDSNAPVITGVDRTCLNTVLKTCLIDGYGNKAPVGGWTMPYASADNRIGVFRNNTEHGGLGHYLQLAQQHQNSYYWTAQCYENMTSESEGTFSYNLNISSELKSSNNSNTTIRPWVLLATDRWLMLFIYQEASAMITKSDAGTSAYATTGFWWGDIEPWLLSDNYYCMFSLINRTVKSNGFGLSSVSTSSTVTSNAYVFPRRADGSGNPVACTAHIAHPLNTAVMGSVGPEYNETNGLLVSRIALNNGAANTLRGWIPDMLAPLHPRPFEHLERVSIQDKTWLAVCFSDGTPYDVSSCGQCLIALAEGE